MRSWHARTVTTPAAGGWRRLADVQREAGDPGLVCGLAAAGVDGDLHLAVVTGGGELLHATQQSLGHVVGEANVLRVHGGYQP